MANVVYCIAPTETHAARIANRLYTEGVPPGNISVLHPDRGGSGDFAHVNSTKAPEGAAVGTGSGMILGGAVGWLVGIGTLAIPGLGPLVAAGPILAALSGAAVGGLAGGVTGALVGLGIPEYEAQKYEGRLRQGGILLAVHSNDSDELSRIHDVFAAEGAEDISTGNEASVPDAQVRDTTAGAARRSF
jgi:hypothetical protein